MTLILEDICNSAPVTQPLIKIQNERQLVLNAELAKLLGLAEGSRVAFKVGEGETPSGKKRIYIGKGDISCYLAHKVHNIFRVYSKTLIDRLTDGLDGQGVYKVEPTPQRDASGNVYYTIFWKRYESEKYKM